MGTASYPANGEVTYDSQLRFCAKLPRARLNNTPNYSG